MAKRWSSLSMSWSDSSSCLTAALNSSIDPAAAVSDIDFLADRRGQPLHLRLRHLAAALVRRERLARVVVLARLERRLEPRHRRQVGLVVDPADEVALLESDPMLAGDRPPGCHALPHDLRARFEHALCRPGHACVEEQV